MIALFEGKNISAVASGALTRRRGVTLTIVAGVLIATAAVLGGRVDAYVKEPAEDGKPVSLTLKPGTDIFWAEAGGTTVAADPVFNYATGTLGPASATLAGEYAGIALEAVSSGQQFRYIAHTMPSNLRLFNKVLDSTDVSNGYVTFTHGFGANPVFWMGQCYVVTTGAARVIAGVTFPTTDTIRFTITSSAAGDSMNAIVARKAF